MRAFRAVASNMRGTGAITRGQKSCAITVKTGDTIVALERSETAGAYRILSGGQTQSFTKLAGGVPEQITQALRIAPVPTGGTSINFAGQFDKPYLLDESGANVARELGELTKVNIIFEAVRTANKKRAAAASALKTRQGDLSTLQAKIVEFADLPGKLRAADTAEKTAENARSLHERVTRLDQVLGQYRLAEQVLARTRLPVVPPIEPLLTLRDRRQRLKALISEITRDQSVIADADRAQAQADTDAATAQQHLDQVLRDAGQCPLCGQRVH